MSKGVAKYIFLHFEQYSGYSLVHVWHSGLQGKHSLIFVSLSSPKYSPSEQVLIWHCPAELVSLAINPESESHFKQSFSVGPIQVPQELSH